MPLGLEKWYYTIESVMDVPCQEKTLVLQSIHIGVQCSDDKSVQKSHRKSAISLIKLTPAISWKTMVTPDPEYNCLGLAWSGSRE